MSEPNPILPLPEPHPAEDPPAEPAPPAAHRRPWRALVLVGGAAFVVGALAATAVTLAVTRGEPHEYAVNVFLEDDVTPDQKAAVDSALDALEPVERRFENRDQAWEQFREMFQDSPEALAAGRRDAMPESFRLKTRGRTFDCAPLTRVRGLAGVDQVQVIQLPTKHEAGAQVACG